MNGFYWDWKNDGQFASDKFPHIYTPEGEIFLSFYFYETCEYMLDMMNRLNLLQPDMPKHPERYIIEFDMLRSTIILKINTLMKENEQEPSEQRDRMIQDLKFYLKGQGKEYEYHALKRKKFFELEVPFINFEPVDLGMLTPEQLKSARQVARTAFEYMDREEAIMPTYEAEDFLRDLTRVFPSFYEMVFYKFKDLPEYRNVIE